MERVVSETKVTGKEDFGKFLISKGGIVRRGDIVSFPIKKSWKPMGGIVRRGGIVSTNTSDR